MNNLKYFLVVVVVILLNGCMSTNSREWLDGANGQQRYQCNMMMVKSQYDECIAKIHESTEVYGQKRTDYIENKTSTEASSKIKKIGGPDMFDHLK